MGSWCEEDMVFEEDIVFTVRPLVWGTMNPIQ
jgi:hypothetical protein